MIKLIKEGNTPNTPIKEYLADREEDISLLPNNIPFGSYLTIIEPFDIRIYNSEKIWKSIIDGDS